MYRYICSAWVLLSASSAVFLVIDGATDHEWDHFVFSQQWAPTVCIDSRLSEKHVCIIPKNVTTWTVHGLWPTNGSTEKPINCNDTAKFDHKQIISILDKLYAYWPNLYNDTEPDSFWEHEWVKHGTCAMSLKALDKEIKYFQKGLDLREKFDLMKILQSGGIVPRDNYTYQYQEVHSVLKKALKTPKLLCTYDKVTKTQYLGEIEFCINKDFDLIKCKTAFAKHQQLQPMVVNYGNNRGSLVRRANSLSSVVKMTQQTLDDQLTAILDCQSDEPIAIPRIHSQKR